MATSIMKINQLVFIKDPIIKKQLIDYNANVISMKTGLAIKMIYPNNYKETKFYKY